MNRLLLAAGAVVVVAAAVLVSRAIPTTAEPAAPDPMALRATSEDKNPWTGLKANADPDSFQFAVVSDRTGGNRGKVFTRAVERLNLLQPEFVLSVGDLINGYTTKPEQIEKEWAEFNGITAKFDMPFFYVPGNHDLTNKALHDDWRARFGRKFYHFTYKGVLFFAVNSEDEDATEEDEKKRYEASFVSAAQTEYFKKVLAESKDVRWVMVFLHKPLWTEKDLDKNGWAAFEKAMEGRTYSVFCGHVHRFQKFVRNGMNYYQLATTGGGSRLRGVEYGEFDHVTWITMKKGGPVISHVMLDGILPEDTIQKDNSEPGRGGEEPAGAGAGRGAGAARRPAAGRGDGHLPPPDRRHREGEGADAVRGRRPDRGGRQVRAQHPEGVRRPARGGVHRDGGAGRERQVLHRAGEGEEPAAGGDRHRRRQPTAGDV
jgi:predicted phosphodiesterase